MKNILYIVWHDNNNVGIPIIDEQHRGIISAINSLHYFMQTGQEVKIINPIMTMLEQYVYIHLNTEEALLAEANYPDIEEHIILHKEFVKKSKKLLVDAVKDKRSDIILKFLKEWWLDHINKEDRKYIPFLKKLID